MTHKDPNSSKSEISQWHLVAFFFQKMIPTETWYKTHDEEFWVIVEAFKTWCQYLKGCKYEVLILIDHNNFRQFMNTKSLSSCQVRRAQEFSRYYFRIDYRQRKVNAVADTLSHFSQRSQAEEKTLQDENTQILHCLQTSLTKVSPARLSLLGHQTANLSPLYQVLIYGTHILPWLCQFWTKLRGKLAQEKPYQ